MIYSSVKGRLVVGALTTPVILPYIHPSIPPSGGGRVAKMSKRERKREGGIVCLPVVADTKRSLRADPAPDE